MSNARLDDRGLSKFLNQRFSPSRRIFLLLWLLIPALVPELVYSRLFIINSSGYVSGRLNSVSLERAFNHAYIGEVTLGRDSITFMSYGNQPHDLVTNPWQFCFEKNRYEEIKSHIGQNIVLEFKTPKNNNLLSCSAINELVAVYPVDEYQAQALEQTHLIGDVLTNNPEIAKGIEFGRIVNVIKNEGSHRNYFMTIQIGGGGSKFHHFVMDDPDLFAFSIISLKTAAMVKIHYSERLSNSFGLNSMSFVSEIEIID